MSLLWMFAFSYKYLFRFKTVQKVHLVIRLFLFAHKRTYVYEYSLGIYNFSDINYWLEERNLATFFGHSREQPDTSIANQSSL